jgi:hypothetical protein
LHYDEKDGLPDASIKGICGRGLGNLWLSTNNGLSKFIEGVNIPVNPKFTNIPQRMVYRGMNLNLVLVLKTARISLFWWQ